MRNTPQDKDEDEKVKRGARLPSGPKLWVSVSLLVFLLVSCSLAFELLKSEKGFNFEIPPLAPGSTTESEQRVFAARLGLASQGGDIIEGSSRGGFSAPSVTLWLSNFDGWLIDQAQNNKVFMEQLGFESRFELNDFLDKRGKFEFVMGDAEYLKSIDEIHKVFEDFAIKSDKPAEDAVDDMLSFTPDRESASGRQYHKEFKLRVLSAAGSNPDLLKKLNKKSVEDLERKFDAHLQTWKHINALREQRFSEWLRSSRLALRLVIGGEIFESIRPEPHYASKVNSGTYFFKKKREGDTIQLLYFKNVAPLAAERSSWRNLISSYGLSCQAPVSVALPHPEGGKYSIMPTLVGGLNTEDGSVERPISIPLRPLAMRALAWSAAFSSVWFIVIIGRTTGALRSRVVMGDGSTKDWKSSPWSASKTVFAWWLAICISSFLFLWAMTASINVLPSSVALLLGVSGGTFIFARTAPGSKTKSESDGLLVDLVSEGDEVEISRLQMLLWNLVLGIVFIWQTKSNWEMPEFDPTLMILLGISSTTYVGYKYVDPKKKVDPSNKEVPPKKV